MPPPPLILYTFAPSPFGLKAATALKYKKASFETRHVHLVSQKEIRFTGQKTIPVLRAGDAWKVGSGDICRWLERLIPEPSFGGRNAAEDAAILEADNWVSDVLIALVRRSWIDKRESAAAHRNNRRIVKILRKTSKGVPPLAEWYWLFLTRSTPFIQRQAALLDPKTPIAELYRNVVAQFDRKLATSGFLAGGEALSYADIAAFAQVAFASEQGMEHQVHRGSSPAIGDWFERIAAKLPD